jgi:lipopolysaccharide export system ATP-binding protein
MESKVQESLPGQKGKRLKASGLLKRYNGTDAVRDVDLFVDPGEIVGLLGPNGAGKTTTFYMVVGLIQADRGHVFLGEEEITASPMVLRARKGISYLSQEASVFQKLTVEQNLTAILENLPLSSADRRERLETLLQDFGIAHLRKQKAYTLSGGERRRVEIARALVISPMFILLDEPFAGIDPIAVSEIQRMIISLKEKGIGVLITDHNAREMLKIADRLYIMINGEIQTSGSPEKVIHDPVVRNQYLGQDFEVS